MHITKKNIFNFVLLLILFLAATRIILTQNITGAEAANLWDQQAGKSDIAKTFGESGEPRDVRVITAQIIKVFLGLLGIIFLGLLIFAGYSWMTAAGEEEKINKAKDTIRRAIIGLIIILAAYSITYFVLEQIRKSTTGDVW